MAPITLFATVLHAVHEHRQPQQQQRQRRTTSSSTTNWNWRATATPEDFVLESWSEGFMVGALLIMACITVANMRKRVPLHKLILAEQLLAMSHGTFCFMSFQGYGWYLSSTAMLLYLSWIIHNIVAWMKVRPFFIGSSTLFNARVGKWTQRVYVGTLALTVPAIVFQISDNFRFFNDRGGWYARVRPYEPLMRDPWWIFTCVVLFHVIRKCYGTGTFELIRRSPRFGILLAAIMLAIAFTVCDVVASIHNFTNAKGDTDGINPWWKFALVFKCLTDTIMLDDFKTELRRLGIKRISAAEKQRNSIALVLDPEDTACDSDPNISKDLWYTNPHKASMAQKGGIQPLKPGGNMEELEFTTALALGPDLSDRVDHTGRGSLSTSSPEREKIESGTRKIGRLPRLKDFKFDLTGSGRKTRKTDRQEQNPAGPEPHALPSVRGTDRTSSISPSDTPSSADISPTMAAVDKDQST